MEIKVKVALDRPGFAYVGVAGICDLTAGGAVCWDAEGKRFEVLEKTIFDYYASSQNKTISVNPGMKNRWIAIESSWPSTEGEWSFADLSFSRFEGPLDKWRKSRSLRWSRVALLKEDAVSSFRVDITKTLPVVEIPMKRGAIADLPNERITLTDFGVIEPPKVKTAQDSGSQAVKYRVLFNVEAKRGSTESMTHTEVVDFDGNLIASVDDEGMPYTSDSGRSSSWPKTFSEVRINGVQLEYTTNVNPRFIKKLQFWSTVRQSLLFQDLPMDPLPVSK